MVKGRKGERREGEELGGGGGRERGERGRKKGERRGGGEYVFTVLSQCLSVFVVM